MLPRLFLACALAALASACVKPPMNAEGFRQMAASDSMWVEVDKFEVDRPYQEVAKTFKSRSDACLRVQVLTSSSGGYMSHPTTFTQDYKPTVKMNQQRAEFYVQIHMEGTNLIPPSASS